MKYPKIKKPNEIKIIDDICYMKVCSKHTIAVTVFDSGLKSLVEKFKWHLDKNGYAIASTGKINGKKKSIRLHRLVLKAKKGQECDHVNRDKLNNLRENLRIVTHRENCLNRKLSLPQWRSNRNKWRARTKINGKEVCVGHFSEYGEALKALRAVQLEHYRKFNLDLLVK